MESWLQPAVALSAIALSAFNLITYLWLGLTVLLIGDRRSVITWIGGMGLLSAALFFLCHGALVGSGLPAGDSPADFWWRLAWAPGFTAPLLWAAIGAHYGSLVGSRRRFRYGALVVVAALGVVTAALAMANWRAIGRYGDFIRLLGATLRWHGQPQPLPQGVSPALPLLGLVFVTYIGACASLPWASLIVRRRRASSASGGGVLSAQRAAGRQDALLWDAADAWSRARPALLGASVCMLIAGGVAASVAITTALSARVALIATIPDALRLVTPSEPPGHVPLALVGADLVVQVALACLGLLMGWAVVRQGVLIERRLPQRGFLSHWRGTALVATLLAAVVVWMAAREADTLPDLLLLVTLMTATYALFTMQSYGEHDRFLAQLRPFITSLTSGHVGWLTTDPREVEGEVEALFTSLCRDVLGASHGRLALYAGRFHRTFTYVMAPEAARSKPPSLGHDWTLPISDERGVVARLNIGARADGAGYTTADLEVARACGQRILDAVGEFTAAQAVASLARRRGLEAELSAALPRRALHDDVLPRLHLAMLRLEALRGRIGVASVAAGATDGGVALATAPDEAMERRIREELGAVVGELGGAHHDLVALMRAAPAANPRRVEHGLVGALRAALDGEFRGAFDALTWKASDEAYAAADALPAIVADLALGATLEAARNAGRHARGADLHRALSARVGISADSHWVTITFDDDGVGLQGELVDDMERGAAPMAASPRTSGARTGLLTHAALMALVGGSLTVHSQPDAGTTVTIRAPRSSSLLTEDHDA